jgi:RNA polymerase sigma factor (sigma-70 family)
MSSATKSIDADNRAIKRLARLLQLDKKHALHFACVRPAQEVWKAADQLEKELGKNTKIANITLRPNEEAPIEFILDSAPESCFATPIHPVLTDKDRCVLFVFGLPTILAMESSARSSALYNLSAQRDQLRELRAPTVFWVDTDTIDLIARSLPDVWNWITSVTSLTFPPTVASTTRNVSPSFSEAFANLVPKLRRTLGRDYNIDDIEDVIQDLYLKLVSKPELLDNVQHLEPYLLVSARHEAARLHARKQRELSIALTEEDIDNWICRSPRDREAFEEYELYEELRQAINELPDQERLIMMLFLQEQTASEIAAMTGLSVSSIRKLTSRARARLRSIVLGES